MKTLLKNKKTNSETKSLSKKSVKKTENKNSQFYFDYIKSTSNESPSCSRIWIVL